MFFKDLDYNHERIEPFRIFGNLYFVGSHFGLTHLIDTGDGLILIDTGIRPTLFLLIDSIRKQGFDPADIRYIVHSHGHFDHTGGTFALKTLYGAKIFLGAEDALMVQGKEDDLASDFGYPPTEPFTPDVLLYDGSRIQLGNTEISCIHTPGHSPGVMSLFFDVTDGRNTYRAGMLGGAGLGAMFPPYSDSAERRQRFIDGLERLKNEHVDIHLGNHAHDNNMLHKRDISTPENNAFVDISGQSWIQFLDYVLAELKKQIASRASGNKE